MIGKIIGPYQVVAKLGEGGMGEVYRAHDTKLGRDVAIKVLPEAVAHDPERLARFRREAQVLASLNHPNIAQIHGLEDGDHTHALVMELVEGPTLEDLIANGHPEATSVNEGLRNGGSAARRGGGAPRGLKMDDALAIARQVAEALEAAHEQGIIHRDLKPANIKVRDDGTVKVLDFGLAKALAQDPEPGTQHPGPSTQHLSMSPTITTPAMTQMGMILGTAAYMSPEQAKGRPASRRSDVWAFGAVLYEMLTSRRAFQGEDVSDTMASVLKADTDWTAFPPDVPAPVVAVIRRCLERDPRRRLRDIGDVWLALEEAVARGEQPAVAPVATRAGAAWPIWVAATAVVTAALAGLLAWSLWPAEAQRSPTRFSHVVPDASVFRRTGGRVVALSPDGRSIVYNTESGLYLRDMDTLDARLIQGSEEDLLSPFFSPDGQQIGYFTPDNQLKRIATSGGTAVLISNVPYGFVNGASWGRDGRILFGQSDGIYGVPASGGTPELLIAAGEDEQLDAPELLPDGATVLFTAAGGGNNRWDEAQIVAASLQTGERTVLVTGGSDARYSPTGHLVYAVDEDLLGVAFDPDRLAVTGGPVPLVEGLARPTNTATANYGISDDGTLAYLDVGALLTTTSRLMWVDREGRPTPVDDREEAFSTPRLSPAGDQVAVSFANAEGNEDIWVLQLARHTWRRLTTDGAEDLIPLWTPDSRRIVFSSDRDGTWNALYWVPADGSGEPEALTTATDGNQGATAWSADGRLVFYRASAGGQVATGYDLFTVVPGEEPVALPQTEFWELSPALSPDGAWLAYASDETGVQQVYVMPFPGPGGSVPVSTGGGRSPRWSASGRELFYRNGTEMMVVDVTPGTNPLDFGSPRLLFDADYIPERQNTGAHNYDVTGDGQRFLLRQATSGEAEAAPSARIVVVKDWFEELKGLVPNGN